MLEWIFLVLEPWVEAILIHLEADQLEALTHMLELVSLVQDKQDFLFGLIVQIKGLLLNLFPCRYKSVLLMLAKPISRLLLLRRVWRLRMLSWRHGFSFIKDSILKIDYDDWRSCNLSKQFVLYAVVKWNPSTIYSSHAMSHGAVW